MHHIETLTPEQDAKLDFYCQKWLTIGLDISATDEACAKEAINEVYRYGDIKPPRNIVFCSSPIAALRRIKVDSNLPDIYGQHDATWLCFYDFMSAELGLVDETKELSGLMKAALYCGWCYLFENAAFVCSKPSLLKMDERGNLHSAVGVAISFPDGIAWHYWHGVAVPDWIIERPQEITIAKIESEKNQEIMRVMIERFGNTRYIEESGAKLIAEDDAGKLYQKQIGNFEPLTMVRVLNSTSEPDGTRHVYYLRVPPACKTAKGAVAWTFSMNESEYILDKET